MVLAKVMAGVADVETHKVVAPARGVELETVSATVDVSTPAVASALAPRLACATGSVLGMAKDTGSVAAVLTGTLTTDALGMPQAELRAHVMSYDSGV